MRDHGLDFSLTASTTAEAVLFTREPYAAVAFHQHATPVALRQLQPILDEVKKSWATESKAHIQHPSDLELWPFQKAGVEYALSRPNVLIGDEPGLGKTPTAVCIANEMRAKAVLVICPASIRLQWIKRIREWTTLPWPYIVHPILSAKNGVHPHAHWTVMSYEMASNDAIRSAIVKRSYDLLVIDEAHFLKEPSSRRTRAIFGTPKEEIPHIAKQCKQIVAMTGTPLPNRPREAYTIAKALDFEAIDWMSERSFQERFNPKRTVRGRNGQIVAVDERVGRETELQMRLRGNFMVRREKHGPNGVMSQLQMPVYDLIQLEKTGPVKQALEAESLLKLDPESLEGADAVVLGHVAVVRRMMGIALAPQVADWTAMLLDGGEHKLVLFGWHIEVLNILQERLSKYGVVRIDGSTSAKAKLERVEAFQNDPNIRICLGNLLAMGVGTDGLQHVSSHALIAEPDWVPGNNVQAIDRLDRGGQRHQVQADIFVAPGSFAERILASALRKMRTIHKALDARI